MTGLPGWNKLYELRNQRTPFASASIGKSFRDGISPPSGLLCDSESLMAEIERFVDPLNKAHPRYLEVADSVSLTLFPHPTQAAGKTSVTENTIGKAVKEGMVDNEELGLFLDRI